jgi:CBS domain-containing protein
MANERVSSLLVESRQGMGIITDRDLRTRVLAPGRASQTPVEAVMSSPLITVSADMPVEEVLLTMLEQGVHHLPVTGDGGSIVGVVTDTDIMGLARADVFALRAEIERAPSRSEAVAAARRLPEVFRGLVDSDVDPVHIGRGIAATIDVLTRRLIEHAIGDQGSPPAPWAWLALGSQGRREQALTTDQDHGLVYQTGGLPADQVDEYFLAVAHSVVQGLEEAGIRRCPGGVMSDNPLWRMPIDRWRAELRHWMSESSPDSRVFPSIALDYRRVAGPLDVEPLLDAEIRMAPEHPQFVRQLVRHALKERPPTGFLRDVVVEDSGEHAGTFDVKHGGIMPITNLARALAVGLGNTSNETLERIRAAMAAGRLERTLGENLAEAFRLLWRVRLDHHADQVEGGTFPDDHVDPSGLDAITRGALKDALRTIARAQRATVLVTGMGPR